MAREPLVRREHHRWEVRIEIWQGHEQQQRAALDLVLEPQRDVDIERVRPLVGFRVRRVEGDGYSRLLETLLLGLEQAGTALFPAPGVTRPPGVWGAAGRPAAQAGPEAALGGQAGARAGRAC